MSRKLGKRKEENEYASDGENPPKKFSKTDDSDGADADGIVVCEISKNRRVSVRSFGGKIMVDIREFYVKDGKQMPGRKVTYFYLSFNRILIFLLWFWYLCF